MLFFKSKTFGLPRSPKWKEVRDRFLHLHPFCAVCGTNKKLEVHHIIPVHIDISKELVESNLITLCESKSHNDHLIFGHFLNWKLFNENVVSDATTYYKSLKEANFEER